MTEKDFTAASNGHHRNLVIASDINGTLIANNKIQENILLFLAHMHRAGHTVGIFSASSGTGGNLDTLQLYAMTKLPKALKENGFSQNDIEKFKNEVLLQNGEITDKTALPETKGFENGVHIVLEDENPNWAKSPNALWIDPTDEGSPLLKQLNSFIENPEKGLYTAFLSLQNAEISSQTNEHAL